MIKGIITLALVATLAGAGVETETEQPYSDDDLYVLSHIINAEAGSDSCSHEHRIAVGSVVLNRVKAKDFPDTIREVVFQNNPVQYTPTINGTFDNEPSEDSVETAKFLLENGSQIPEECIWQAEFLQGSGEWNHYDTPYSTTYICYR